MADVEQESREKFRRTSAETGTCPAFRVFNLGSNGTVYVGCGLKARHWRVDEVDEDQSWPIHMAIHNMADGQSSVVFRWPVEE